jgi:two-component system, OmpR family, aerobic respiration control sensor histidine kinase ArcB
MEKFPPEKREINHLKATIEKQQAIINEQKTDILRLTTLIEKSSHHLIDKHTVSQSLDEAKFLAMPSRVLLVEDHRVAEKVTKNMLAALHCQVDIAMDGKMALELIKHQHYDLVFMDVGLPDMKGDEITRRIRTYELAQGTHIPIIALTAHTDSKTQQQCLDAGMNAVISKPLCQEEAEKILNAFIPARRKSLERQSQNIQNEEKIVDFNYAKKLLGDNETLVWETLTMFVQSFPHEAKKLEEAYQQENWEAIQTIANKLKGSASYCGTLRLKAVCTELDNYIESGLTMLISELYQQLLTELDALGKFMANPKIL